MSFSRRPEWPIGEACSDYAQTVLMPTGHERRPTGSAEHNPPRTGHNRQLCLIVNIRGFTYSRIPDAVVLARAGRATRRATYEDGTRDAFAPQQLPKSYPWQNLHVRPAVARRAYTNGTVPRRRRARCWLADVRYSLDPRRHVDHHTVSTYGRRLVEALFEPPTVRSCLSVGMATRRSHDSFLTFLRSDGQKFDSMERRCSAE